MGSKAPQPPPPEHQVGDYVLAAVDIWIGNTGSATKAASKGQLLRIEQVNAKGFPYRVAHLHHGMYAAFGVTRNEITKPPRPTSPPPPRKP